jgi:GTPase SAR1 family protein
LSEESVAHVISTWLPELDNEPTAKRVLVATKEDLVNDEEVLRNLTENNQKIVPMEELEQLAKSHAIDLLLSCSALTGQGVNHVFESALRLAVNTHEIKGHDPVIPVPTNVKNANKNV